MISFSLSRGLLNVGLSLVYPRWRYRALMIGLAVALIVIVEGGLLKTRANLSDLSVAEYLQYPDPDYWSMAVTMLCIGLLPIGMLVGFTPSFLLARPRPNERIDAALRSLGFKGTPQSRTLWYYHGTYEGRDAGVFVNTRPPQRGVFIGQAVRKVRFPPTLDIRLSASHMAAMSVLRDDSQILGKLPPDIQKIEVDRSVLPGAMMTTRDVDWSREFLGVAKVNTALRRLLPEGNPGRNVSVSLAAHLVLMRILFYGSEGGPGQLEQFVTHDQMVEMLAALKEIAEAAEAQRPPEHPDHDDPMARALARDPLAGQALVKVVIMLMMSVCLTMTLGSSLFR
jgi:hypothetical protein